MEIKQDKELFQPIEFWSDTVKLLDGRIGEIAKTYGFGEVSVVIKIKHGKVLDVIFKEEIAVRQQENDKNESVQKDAT